MSPVPSELSEKKTTGYGFHEILVVFNRDPFSVIFTGEITNMDTKK